MGNQKRDEIKKIAESGYGRANADRLVEIIKQRPSLFKDLMEVYFANEESASRRAVWAIDIHSEEHPEIIHPYIERICTHLPDLETDHRRQHRQTDRYRT